MTLFSWFIEEKNVKHPDTTQSEVELKKAPINQAMWPTAKVRASLLNHQRQPETKTVKRQVQAPLAEKKV